jgi:hypothetical protein
MHFLRIKKHIFNTQKMTHAEMLKADDGKFVIAINFDTARGENSVVLIDFDTEKDCRII